MISLVTLLRSSQVWTVRVLTDIMETRLEGRLQADTHLGRIPGITDYTQTLIKPPSWLPVITDYTQTP